MGMPMSWTALSIIHYCIASLVDCQHNFRIKGDDLIAYWTAQQIQLYQKYSAAVGLLVNDKTWTHRKLGTFCEGDYELVLKDGPWVVLKRLPTFSLKSFVKNEPFPYEIGERFISRGVPRELLFDMQAYYHVSWRKLAHEKGVNPYAPSRLGGLGFVPKLDHPLDELTARAVNASHNGLPLRSEREDHRYKGLASMCLGSYSRVRWSVFGTLDPVAFDREFSSVLATCSFMDAHRAILEPRAITPGKRVRALRAFRQRFLKSGVKTVFVPTSVQTAYSVLGRLKPIELSEQDEVSYTYVVLPNGSFQVNETSCQ
jgi:hypothetical protein